jgi:hypothetical protein
MSRHFTALDYHSAETVPAAPKIRKPLKLKDISKFPGKLAKDRGSRKLGEVQQKFSACSAVCNTRMRRPWKQKKSRPVQTGRRESGIH